MKSITIKPQSEKEITKAIRGVLRGLGIFHWKNFGGPMCQPGVPDILGIKKVKVSDLVGDGIEYVGIFTGIEIKAQNGRVSDLQKKFIDSINREGGIAFVVRSVDELIDNLGIRDRFLI